MLEDGALIEGPPNVDEAVSKALTAETTIGPSLQARQSNLTIPDIGRVGLPNRLMLGSYVKPMEWGCPSVDTPTPGPYEARLIIDRQNPFNKRDSFAAYLRKFYPNILRIPLVDRAKEYSIPFPNYMDKKSY